MTTKPTTREVVVTGQSAAAASTLPLAAPPSRLMTREQVIALLASEVAASSLTAVSRHYGLAPQQVSDILHGRAGLSRRVLDRLRMRLVEYYERTHSTKEPVA